LRVPPIIAARVLSDVIDKFRRSARSVEDKQAIVECSRLLRRLRASLPRRPRHRPRNWIVRQARADAVHEFELMRLKYRNDGLSRDEAIERAATEVAPCYAVKPATIKSWWAHPGRRLWPGRRRK
jgi:hypothetical protein